MIVAKSLNFAKGTWWSWIGAMSTTNSSLAGPKLGSFSSLTKEQCQLLGLRGSAAPQEQLWQRIEGSGDLA